jgi:hypothetical protein
MLSSPSSPIPVECRFVLWFYSQNPRSYNILLTEAPAGRTVHSGDIDPYAAPIGEKVARIDWFCGNNRKYHLTTNRSRASTNFQRELNRIIKTLKKLIREGARTKSFWHFLATSLQWQ